MNISARGQGTPAEHVVGVAFCVPVSVPLELAGAPVTLASTNAVQLPAFEVVESHPQLFAVLGPSVSVAPFDPPSQLSEKPDSPTVAALVPHDMD